MAKGGRTIQTRSRHVRFVVLLFAIATTCELAAFAPALVRRAMLYFLLKAETVAHSIVYWAYRDCGAALSWALPEQARHENSAEAAFALSAWFRTLAIALRDLPRRALIEKHRPQTSLSDCLRIWGAASSATASRQSSALRSEPIQDTS